MSEYVNLLFIGKEEEFRGLSTEQIDATIDVTLGDEPYHVWVKTLLVANDMTTNDEYKYDDEDDDEDYIRLADYEFINEIYKEGYLPESPEYYIGHATERDHTHFLCDHINTVVLVHASEQGDNHNIYHVIDGDIHESDIRMLSGLEKMTIDHFYGARMAQND